MTQVTIASGSQIAADAGVEIARLGGNAVDCAIASLIVSMCTESGIIAPGSSGFITIWHPDHEPIVIDAYAEMPGRGLSEITLGQGATQVFLDYGGGMHTIIGYGSVATPGIFAGLGLASAKYGNLPWSELLKPAIRHVEQGFKLSGGSAQYLAYSHHKIFGWHPDSYRTLHDRNGNLLQEGDKVIIPGLADSLRLLAEEGVATLYQGELGRKIAAEIQENNGILTIEDLNAYQAIERVPITIRFDDWEIVTNPAPAVGGACLAAMLLLLDRQHLEQWDENTVSAIAQIQEAVLNYRAHTLDTTQNHELAVSNLLNLAKLGDINQLNQSPSTIHTSTVDNTGLACAITASSGYGSGVMIKGTGFWLNNSLGEIELHPQGLAGLSPGTRLISNMSPTIARKDDGTVLAIGSPGASRITTAIAQTLFNFVHLQMPLQDAIAHPRLHFEMFENTPTIAYESNLPINKLNHLVTRQFPDISMYFGGVQAALWSPQFGLSAAADPRRAGGIAWG